MNFKKMLNTILQSIILNVYACLRKLRRYFASLSRNLDASLISLQSELDALIVRAVGRSENPGVLVLFDGFNLPPWLRKG